jgi:L-amino acid N-acyltransferase YncA
MTTSTAFTIEPARDENLEAVAALYRDWVEEGKIIGMVADSVEDLRQKLGPYFFVARADGCLVGFVTAIERNKEPGE